MEYPEAFKATVERFKDDYDTISYTERDLMYYGREQKYEYFGSTGAILDEEEFPEGEDNE